MVYAEDITNSTEVRKWVYSLAPWLMSEKSRIAMRRCKWVYLMPRWLIWHIYILSAYISYRTYGLWVYGGLIGYTWWCWGFLSIHVYSWHILCSCYGCTRTASRRCNSMLHIYIWFCTLTDIHTSMCTACLTLYTLRDYWSTTLHPDFAEKKWRPLDWPAWPECGRRAIYIDGQFQHLKRHECPPIRYRSIQDRKNCYI